MDNALNGGLEYFNIEIDPETLLPRYSYEYIDATRSVNIIQEYPCWGVYIRREEARKRARAKSLDLLKSFLSPGQLETLDFAGCFSVYGSKTGRKYTLYEMKSTIIRDDGVRFCLDSLEDIPIYDLMLAQKMLLEDDEGEFLRAANRVQGDYPLLDYRQLD